MASAPIRDQLGDHGDGAADRRDRAHREVDEGVTLLEYIEAQSNPR